MDTTTRRPRPALYHPKIPLTLLLLPPLLLAVLTVTTLFHISTPNLYMLYSQCHARARLPFITHSPLLPSFIATPLCYTASFFTSSLASFRTLGPMAVVLAFVAGLLTVSTVESARICNAPAVLIAYPAGLWLVFDMVGGAVVWELVILPAFFKRGREIVAVRWSGDRDGEAGREDPLFGEAMRHLRRMAEIVAIPVAVAVGFVVPAVVMLVTGWAGAVLVWLFFPVWVAGVRAAVRSAVMAVLRRDGEGGRSWEGSFHLEGSRVALVGMYALPVLCSVVAQGLLVWSVFVHGDDRKEMTRATSGFVFVDMAFVALTVLYWMVVEAGWKVAAVMAAASTVLGPGAGVCVGWVYRERMVDLDRSVTVVAVGARSGDASPTEDTPLLR
ncbi:hypothetical protein B0T19DRAFT_442580 [Cercophora scortea]|uniref:Uncharacterized protein n=1 Tax=Cercophora scortea TaxID=314031 RepID=A0AAE0IP11_9PEZI|nr:hypothetical protein B0T19DRAFT_442580 [Cercophora scortea]